LSIGGRIGFSDMRDLWWNAAVALAVGLTALPIIVLVIVQQLS
jgi:hypothetical protein